jgi:hypothetical protein
MLLCLFSFLPRSCRKSSWRLLLILSCLVFTLRAHPATALRTETHRYLEQSGDESHHFDWILRKEGGYLLRAVSPGEEHRTIMDETSATRRWTLTKAAEGTEVEARREGDLIVLSGRFGGKRLDTQLTIDQDPWFQSLSTSLRFFLSSGEEILEFWTLRPDKLTVHKVRATMKGLEVLQLGGRQVEARKIEVGLTGLAGLFGRARYWFRNSDHLFLLYRGPSGLPGIPTTTITLEPPF